MEPMHSVSYYLEFQKQLSTSKGSSQQLVDVPADQELNSLRSGQALVGVGAIDEADIKPPVGATPYRRSIFVTFWLRPRKR
jgi:hypothetical protein